MEHSPIYKSYETYYNKYEDKYKATEWRAKMPEYKTEFKRWCVENRYSAVDIAEATGIAVYTIYAYMEGRRYPKRENLKRLAETFGFDARDIFPL